MDFSLSEDQELFRKFVRKYLVDHEQTKIARDYIAHEVANTKKAIAGLDELGCTQLNIPEDFDGMGLGQLDLVPIFEEYGRVLMPGVYLETSAIVVPLLKKYGTEDQKQTYLTKIANQEIRATVAWLEPGNSYAEKGIQLAATAHNGAFLLNGIKTQVPDCELATHMLIPFRNEQRVTLALVPLDAQGVTVRAQESFDETRKLSEVTLSQVVVEAEQLIALNEDGFAVLTEGLLTYNASLSSVIVGAMEQIVHTASEYANIREQFGQPIGRYQAIKHRLADMKLQLETARSLSYYANWAIETHSEDCNEAVYSARIFATEAFIEIAAQNIQIHGGIGFTEEIDCHLFVKRSRFYENYLGTNADYYDQAIQALNWVGMNEAVRN